MSSAFIFQVRRVGDYDKCDLKISRGPSRARTSSYNFYIENGETPVSKFNDKIVALGIFLTTYRRVSLPSKSKFIDRFIDDRRFIQI